MTMHGGRGLHGQVVHALGERMMRGDLVPGQSINTEDVMVEFDVSRTVVREALRVLTAKGLVDARPKHGTYVTERSRWELLDTDVMRWRTEGVPDARLVRELDQVRAIIEPAAAGIAAGSRTSEQLAAIEAAHDKLIASFDDDDEAAHIETDVAFHIAILAASGNELLERFEVVLEPAMQARHRLALRHATTTSFLDSHRAVFEAIAAGDPDAARERMQLLIDDSARDIAAIVGA
ncbi:GntR family transcriptional regulator [Leifsonia sp. Leaf264]|nr:GntR family transcriptional regulator [Leifsonia sp. Leaf264]